MLPTVVRTLNNKIALTYCTHSKYNQKSSYWKKRTQEPNKLGFCVKVWVFVNPEFILHRVLVLLHSCCFVILIQTKMLYADDVTFALWGGDINVLKCELN